MLLISKVSLSYNLKLNTYLLKLSYLVANFFTLWYKDTSLLYRDMIEALSYMSLECLLLKQAGVMRLQGECVSDDGDS